MKIFVLILGSVIAFLMLKYRTHVKNFTGDIGFAEKIFGIGGTHTFIVFLGILVFLFSLMYALGTLEVLLDKVLGRFF